MSWQDRLQQMVLAGGVLVGGCGSGAPAGPDTGGAGAGGGPAFPCGNANPDPCICGRPDASSQAAAECQAEIACTASGGVWFPYMNGTSPPYCQMDGGTDSAANADGGSDGTAD